MLSAPGMDVTVNVDTRLMCVLAKLRCILPERLMCTLTKDLNTLPLDVYNRKTIQTFRVGYFNITHNPKSNQIVSQAKNCCVFEKVKSRTAMVVFTTKLQPYI